MGIWCILWLLVYSMLFYVFSVRDSRFYDFHEIRVEGKGRLKQSKKKVLFVSQPSVFSLQYSKNAMETLFIYLMFLCWILVTFCLKKKKKNYTTFLQLFFIFIFTFFKVLNVEKLHFSWILYWYLTNLRDFWKCKKSTF